jgi:hypothetical protein
LRIDGIPNQTLAIAAGLIGQPSAVAGRCKPAEYTHCRTILLL